jgi:hypothetical protein
MKTYKEELGYDVSRTAGSHGKFDLITVHPHTGVINLIQCKTVESKVKARNLIRKFKDSPPYPPYNFGVGVHQIIAVKVMGTSDVIEGIV